MKLLNGFVSLINALAWPSASLVIAVLFRRELRLAMGRLGQVKYGAMEVTFREDLRKAEALAQAVPRVDAPATPTPPLKINLEIAPDEGAELVGTLVGHEVSTLNPTATNVLVASQQKADPRSVRGAESLLRLCERSPREGILETWGELSRVLIHASAILGDRRSPAPLRVETALRFLVERGWLNSVEGQLVDRLRSLADQVERFERPPVALDDARRFIELAMPLINRVVSLG